MFTQKTQFRFEPGVSGVALDATGAAYTTPNTWEESLANLARLPYVNANFRYKIAQSAKPTAGAATAKLMAGSTVIASQAVDLTSAQTISGSFAADLSLISGQTPLSVQIEIGTAADAGTTAAIYAALDVDVPLMVTANG